MQILGKTLSKIPLVSEGLHRYKRNWKSLLLIIFRLFILISIARGFLWNEWPMSVFTLITYLLIVYPNLFTRGIIKSIPLEIELLFQSIIIIQNILGEIHNLYYRVPYFDKFVHTSVSLFAASISMLIMLALNADGKLKISKLSQIILVIFVAMGIGTLWEIIEYIIDVIGDKFSTEWVTFQGSPKEAPLPDTMHDMIVNLIGAIMGALAVVYSTSERKMRKDSRLVREINENLPL